MADDFEVSEAPIGDEPAQDVRTCRYRRCGRSLPVQTRPGRKKEYCVDRQWEDGRSCKEMEQAEQRAERAAGLEVPLAAYRVATERVAPALRELRERLDAVLSTAADVDTAALTRVQDAETAMSAAVARAQEAESKARSADNQRADAVRQSKADREAKLGAERLARDADREKREDVLKAWGKVAEAEAAKGVAEGKASELQANLDAYIKRFKRLAEEHDALVKTNKDLERDNTRLDAQLRAARTTQQELSERATAAEDKVTSLNEELSGLREQLAGETARAQTAERDRDTARAELGTEITRTDGLQRDLGTLREELAAARTRAKSAETDRDQAHHDLRELGERLETLREDLGAARGRAAAAEADATRLREASPSQPAERKRR